MKETELSIDGMHCDGCVRRVTAALKKIPGVVVETVQVGKARVRYDEQTVHRAALVAAVDGLGFRARGEEG